MKKTEILLLRNYIETNIGFGDKSLQLYFTNHMPYSSTQSKIISVKDLSSQNVTLIKKHLKSSVCQDVKIENSKVASAMAYLLVLGDMFTCNESPLKGFFQIPDKKLFEQFNKALLENEEPAQFMNNTFGIKGVDDEYVAEFKCAAKFIQLPENERNQMLGEVLKACRGIDQVVQAAYGKNA